MTATLPTEQLETFDAYRSLLFAISYRMLGSVMDAEDIVQETYLRWSQVEPGEIASPKAYLSAIATRLSIDQLRSARVQREQYLGPWLPEPIAAEEQGLTGDPAVLTESLSQAFLVVLETLSPVERAIFLLHDVFDYDFEEIAGIVGKNPANCRQIAHRARQHVASRRPRFTASEEAQDRLVQEFVSAASSGDVERLIGVLADDAILWADGGGKAPAGLRPIQGADHIARGATGFAAKYAKPLAGYQTRVNGQLALIATHEDQVVSVMTFEMTEDRIHAIWVVANPDKLQTLNAVWPRLQADGAVTYLGQLV